MDQTKLKKRAKKKIKTSIAGLYTFWKNLSAVDMSYYLFYIIQNVTNFKKSEKEIIKYKM